MWAFPDWEQKDQAETLAVEGRPRAPRPWWMCKHKSPTRKRFSCLAKACGPGNQAGGGADVSCSSAGSGPWTPAHKCSWPRGSEARGRRGTAPLLGRGGEAGRSQQGPSPSLGAPYMGGVRAFLAWLQESLRAPTRHLSRSAGQGGSGSLASSRWLKVPLCSPEDSKATAQRNPHQTHAKLGIRVPGSPAHQSVETGGLAPPGCTQAETLPPQPLGRGHILGNRGNLVRGWGVGETSGAKAEQHWEPDTKHP